MKEVVKKRNIFFLWLEWHLIDATFFLFRAWKNILLFNIQFFSIFFLLRTLFSYWHKYRWYYKGGLNIAEYFNVFFSNLISRFLGSIMRISLIIIGIIIEVMIIITGAGLIIVWIFLPFITLTSFIVSFALIF